MRLRDWVILGAGILVFILWTEYAFERGAAAAEYECYEAST